MGCLQFRPGWSDGGPVQAIRCVGGSVVVFDVQRASEFLGGGLVSQHRSIFVVDKQHERGHKYAVSSAIWYPVDTGLFVTGSYDHCINVWDTNTVQVKVIRAIWIESCELDRRNLMIVGSSILMLDQLGLVLNLFFRFLGSIELRHLRVIRSLLISNRLGLV